MASALPAIAGSVVSGIIGQAGRSASSGDRDAANRAAQEAYQALQNIGLPPDLSTPIILQQFQQAGMLTPELEQTIRQGPSKLAEIKADQGLVDTQKEALEAIKQRGKVGLTPEDRAALNQVREQVAQDEEAKRQQIMQSMQARGQGSSGANLAAQLMSSQASTNRAARGSDELAAQASRRALEAMATSGQLAGQMRTQDIGEQSTRARAEDELNRFNTTNRQNVQARNVGYQNMAQEQNLQRQQGISDKNIALANAEKQRQADAKRQYWTDRAYQATGQANQATNQANYRNQQAALTQNQYANLGTTFGNLSSGIVKSLQEKPEDEVNTFLGNYDKNLVTG